MKLLSMGCVCAFALLATISSALANIPGGGDGTGPNVTLVNNGTSLTLSNGLVSAVIDIAHAEIWQLSYNGVQVAYGTSSGQAFYWQGSSGNNCTLRVMVDPASNGGNYALLQFYCSYTNSGDGVDAYRYFTMFRGSPGIYASQVLVHDSTMPAGGADFPSLTGKLSGNFFNWIANDTGRNQLMFTGADTRVHVGNSAPKEVSLITTGQLAGRYECKYDFAGDLGALGFSGWCTTNLTTNFGVWMVHPSDEYFTCGPMHREILAQYLIIQTTFKGVHFGFNDDTAMAAGENWHKVDGPFFIYFNSVAPGTPNPQTALYSDAQAQTAAERGAWPYAWFTDTNYVQAAGRGEVTGKIAIADSGNPNASASNLWVGLMQQPTTTTVPAPADFQFWGKNYQYWTHSDANGNFVFTNVIAGTNYTLFAFGPGAIGMFQSQPLSGASVPVSINTPASPFSVTVVAAATNNLGTVTWTPTRVGATVWELGVPDRDSAEFRHGNDYWHGDMGNATNFAANWAPFQNIKSDFPNGVNYTVGQSHWDKDWNYAQAAVLNPVTGSLNGSGNWAINFSLPGAPTNGVPASLYFGFASDYSGPVVVKVNGTDVAGSNGFAPSYSSSGANNDAMIRMSSHGIFADYRLNFSSSLLHAGTNTITLNMRKGGYFANSALYDYIRLELGGYVPPAPASLSASAGNGRVSLFWPAAPGATGYDVLRSNTSGTGYTAIATNIVGPICGSVDDTATFADTNAANGATYYYVVRSTNPNGGSTNSVEADASPSAGAPGVPATPANVVAAAGNNQVSLSWNAVPGASRYAIQRTVLTIGAVTTYAPSGINPYEVINSYVAGTNFTDTALANNVTYSYQVSAANASGQSAFSAAANASPIQSIPATPVSLSASVVTNQATITWPVVPDAAGYIISRASSISGPYTVVANPEVLASFVDSGLDYNTTYYYEVAAANLGGISTNSVPVAATTTPAAPAPIGAIPGDAAVAVNWGASAGATNYVLQRATTSGGPYTPIYSTTNTSHLDTGRVNGVTYYYVAYAVGPAGPSPLSVEVAATPSANAPIVATATLTATTITNETSPTLATSGNFDLNGGNAVALLVTAECSSAAPVFSATFAGQPMLAGVSTHQANEWSGIFYLINPDITSGPFVIASTNSTTGGGGLAYSAIALGNVGVASDFAAWASATTSQGTQVPLITTNFADGGFVLGSCVNNGYSSRPQPTFVSGNASNILLNTLVNNNSGHLHTYGGAALAGIYTNIYSNPYSRSAYVTLAFDTANALAQLTWAAGNGVWDIGTTSNWNNGAGPAAYQQQSQSGNPVRFEDALSGASPITVTLNTNVYPNGITVSNNTKAYTISGSGRIGGVASLEKFGVNTLTLSGANTYNGDTIVGGGTLMANNTAGSATGAGLVTVNSGGTLGGNGVIAGDTTINGGGTLAPGMNGIGTLTFGNSLTLASGSTNIFEISQSPLANDVVAINGTLASGGDLIVTNVGGGTLTSGDSFKLFDAGSYSGGFARVVLPPLSADLDWDTSALNTNGTVSVVVKQPGTNLPIVVTATLPGTTGSAATRGTIATSATFDLNGGNAVALLYTAEGGSADEVGVTFADQPMNVGVVTNDTGAGAQWAYIFYLLNPSETSGQFVITNNAAGGTSFAYSAIALGHVTGVAGSAAVGSTATAGTISLNYATATNGGFVLGACVNNGYGSHPAPSFVSGNADQTLLASTLVGSSGHLHTYGEVPSAGTYMDVYGNPYDRNAYVTLAFEGGYFVPFAPPLISGMQASGANLTISGSGGAANWPFYVLMSTNLSAGWTPVATNYFDAAGRFTLIMTNAVGAGSGQAYYRLQLQP